MKRGVVIAIVVWFLLIFGMVFSQQKQVLAQQSKPPVSQTVVGDEDAGMIQPPQQVAIRYSPNFIKYVTTNIIKVDEFLLDEEGNVTRWCAVAVYEKESAELIHCLN